MKKYTANYCYTNPNFVIQNLVVSEHGNEMLPILYVLKNLLQRGFPTRLSKYLQTELGEIHKFYNFQERLLFATIQTPIWTNTIKGDKERNYYPAKTFFETIIPGELGEYPFIQSLIIPEIEITEIVGEYDPEYANQQVDFYLPLAKLVIEIDGQQHKKNEVNRLSDVKRDNYLATKGITTIRISTRELQTGQYTNKIVQISTHLNRFAKTLAMYQAASEKIEGNELTEEHLKTKLLPTAIIRFQILIIELLTHNYLNFKNDWNLNILAHEDLQDFALLATNDLQIWLKNLHKLKSKCELDRPVCNIKVTNDKSKFHPTSNAINIDFSLFKRYTDENRLNEDVIYVRTDYFDNVKERNYFKVSTATPINYEITDEDKPVLEFFLENIFDKKTLREGQFPIIANALNRKDTIGLLPTGGGKSICYQLPCLLQPSINLVICPIKSLMYDQNDNLIKSLITNVNFITSDLEPNERRQIEYNLEQGRYLFVWISPEKLQIPNFRDRLSAIISRFSMAYAVVDEVHCLSEWGHDFRLSYLNLAKTIDKLSPKDDSGNGTIKFIGLTATASVHVLKDIKIEFSRQKQRLEDENIKSLLDYSRKELHFEIINDKGNKGDCLKQLINQLKVTEDFTNSDEKAGLIFTPNVNGAFGCYQLSNTLNIIYKDKVGWFSGDIPKRDLLEEGTGRKIGTEPVMSRNEFNNYKQSVQRDFKENKYQLLVATKAFGMGIDKQNIHYTFHYGLPSSVEALYQEAGRAGRWDKRLGENRHKVGRCYVLHTPETQEKEKVELLFNKDTTFAEMKAVSDDVGFSGRDIFKQVFLFMQGQNDIEKDFEIIVALINRYYAENTTVRIFWNEAFSELRINSDVLQKAIYRLSLLGVISDWTTNFIDHYEVQFASLDDSSIIKELSGYITKYQPAEQIERALQQIDRNNILEKAIWYLLKWTFDNIAYNRKQSLKTISDWCSEFKDSESFKQRIDSYFIFSEKTFILQHIAENPNDYRKWFDVLTNDGHHLNKTEFERLRDSISRYLESYRNNLGLNIVSGYARLALGEYKDSDGKDRFESGFSSIKEKFSTEMVTDLLSRLKQLAKNLSEEQKTDLTTSISRFYPEVLEEFAEYYDLAYLLNDIYAEKLKGLNVLNKKLYEQLAKIQ